MNKQIDEDKLRKIKIKLLISHDQWKELKAHMYWTFILFSVIISLALLYKVFPTWDLNNIEYSHLISSILIFSIVFILFSTLKFSSRFALLIGFISIIHLIIFLSCNLLLQERVELLQFREIVENIIISIFTLSEKEFVCTNIGSNTPVGTFVYWSIYFFSQYIESNYRNVANTLKEFEAMEQELKEKMENKDQKNDENKKDENKKSSTKKGKSKTS